MECKFHGAVKLKAQGAGLRFTRRVRRQIPAPPPLSHCDSEDIMSLGRSEAMFIWDIRVQSMVAEAEQIIGERLPKYLQR